VLHFKRFSYLKNLKNLEEAAKLNRSLFSAQYKVVKKRIFQDFFQKEW